MNKYREKPEEKEDNIYRNDPYGEMEKLHNNKDYVDFLNNIMYKAFYVRYKKYEIYFIMN